MLVQLVDSGVGSKLRVVLVVSHRCGLESASAGRLTLVCEGVGGSLLYSIPPR